MVERAPRLAELARGLGKLAGDGNTRIENLAIDSRQVSPGSLFVCLPGFSTDGHRFLDQALERGAAAVVVERTVTDPGVPVLEVPSATRALALLANRFYGHPSREIRVLGVTGTNGKTTVAHLTAAALDTGGTPSAVVGTLGVRFGDMEQSTTHTTPTADRFQALLRTLVDAGAGAVCAEVSSHALATQRTYGTRFAAVAFTNLTRDHLDFHGSPEKYLDAKLALFDRRRRGDDGPPLVAVVHLGDPMASRFVECARAGGDRVITVGDHPRADVRIGPHTLDADGVRGEIVHAGGVTSFRLALPGRFNLENALVAFALATGLGVDPATAARGLESVRRVPGRLERVDGGGPVRVFVDYAHTPDALETVLGVLKPLATGRLIAVFGCGGDRDPGKRPLMAAAVARHADRLILTSDNPRTEDPQQILDDTRAGLPDHAIHEVIADRRVAIRRAIELARPGDVVVIAGKGHERVQVVGSRTLAFDDREEALAALDEAGLLGAG